MVAVSVFSTLAQDATAKLGRHDDGREGAVLTKTLQGGLVKVPFLNYGMGTAGTATATWDGGSTANNPDGSGTSVSLTCTNGLVNAVAWIENQLWGPVIGIRYLRDNNANRPPAFGVIIDGVVYKVPYQTPIDRVGNASSTPEYEAAVIVADDLGPGPHTVRVVLYGDVNGSSTRSLNAYGFLLDPATSYQQRQPAATIVSGQVNLTVPTTAASFGSGGNQRIAALHFRNTHASTAHTVTLLRSGVIWKTITLAAQADFDYVFPGGPFQVLSAWTWQVDAGTDVVGTLITGGSQ